MARPKKDKSNVPLEDRIIEMQYSAFMNMQNSIAHTLNVYHQMATNAMQATSQQLGAINAAMLQVQLATKKHMADNNIDPNTADLTAYQPLTAVLNLDKTVIGNPLADPHVIEAVPAAPAVSDAKVKKERKARKPKDPNAPKRPLTGYLMYYTESKDALEKRLRTQLGGDVSKGRVQEEGKNVWNAMQDKEKEVWKEKYKVEWEKYQEAVKEYQAKGGIVEDNAIIPADAIDTIIDAAVNEIVDVNAAQTDVESGTDDSEDEEPAKEPTPPPPPPAAAKKTAKGRKSAGAAAKDADKPDGRKRAAAKEATPRKNAQKKDSPESAKKTPKVDSPEVAKKGKKRKSAAAAADDEPEKADKKKKRKSGYGDDY